jgi:hypothetical protein
MKILLIIIMLKLWWRDNIYCNLNNHVECRLEFTSKMFGHGMTWKLYQWFLLKEKLANVKSLLDTCTTDIATSETVTFK